jgi:hypothetical protein
LANKLPVKSSADLDIRRKHQLLMIQMRMICPKGLFKGCLMVTDDETLCKPGCVVFTKSMKKSEGSLRFSKSTSQSFTMDVCKTFEKSEFFPVFVLYNI